MHTSHPEIFKRLKRAEGHLPGIVKMLEDDNCGCLDVAQQLRVVENAIASAKRVMVQDHIDHCLEGAVRSRKRDSQETLAEFKEITKYL